MGPPEGPLIVLVRTFGLFRFVPTAVVRRSRAISIVLPDSTPAPRLLGSLVVHADRIEHIEHPAWCQTAARMN
jgi:hypothetical protein